MDYYHYYRYYYYPKKIENENLSFQQPRENEVSKASKVEN